MPRTLELPEISRPQPHSVRWHANELHARRFRIGHRAAFVWFARLESAQEFAGRFQEAYVVPAIREWQVIVMSDIKEMFRQ